MTNEELKAYTEKTREKLRQQRLHDATTFSRGAIKNYLRFIKEMRPDYGEALDFAADLFDRLDGDPSR